MPAPNSIPIMIIAENLGLRLLGQGSTDPFPAVDAAIPRFTRDHLVKSLGDEPAA